MVGLAIATLMLQVTKMIIATVLRQNFGLKGCTIAKYLKKSTFFVVA